MADLFKNKYRIKSTRFENWDYRWNAAYFVTICTANRRHYFGEIKNGKMQFSPTGAIAEKLWHEIPHHVSHVELGNFIVMPNHIHGILILDNPEISREEKISEGNDEEKKNDSPGNHPKDPVLRRCMQRLSRIPKKISKWQRSPQNPIPFQPSLDPINLPLQNMPTGWDMNLNGKQDFMI